MAHLVSSPGGVVFCVCVCVCLFHLKESRHSHNMSQRSTCQFHGVTKQNGLQPHQTIVMRKFTNLYSHAVLQPSFVSSLNVGLARLSRSISLILTISSIKNIILLVLQMWQMCSSCLQHKCCSATAANSGVPDDLHVTNHFYKHFFFFLSPKFYAGVFPQQQSQHVFQGLLNSSFVHSERCSRFLWLATSSCTLENKQVVFTHLTTQGHPGCTSWPFSRHNINKAEKGCEWHVQHHGKCSPTPAWSAQMLCGPVLSSPQWGWRI